MAVKRIVANIAADDPKRAGAQVGAASEGGSDTPIPDLSIEVDDLDDVHQRAVAAGFSIE
jgi:hypothetical protein